MKKDLSIIIPFVGEYPQVLFTIQSTAQSLIDSNIDFEIIAVDNWCEQAKEQAVKSADKALNEIGGRIFRNDSVSGFELYEACKSIYPTFHNPSGASVAACSRGNDWLKYVKYEKRLSHWQAKRVGVENSSGLILLFMDAHVIPYNIKELFYDYILSPEMGSPLCRLGTLHMPLTYKILEWRKLIYKMKIENEHFYHYSFTGFRAEEEPYEVPCMSTCGMMISRDIYDTIGGWPTGLGIYGGGENFMNYTLAVCGFKKFIHPSSTLFHHGDKRDYHWVYDDHVKNRMIAHYLFGGEDLLAKFKTITKGRPGTLELLASETIAEHKEQRQKIKDIQEYSIQEWVDKWNKSQE